MKPSLQLVMILLACATAVAQDEPEDDASKIIVTQPLTQVERSSAVQLSRLRSARLWWNDDNRIVGVSLKGVDANNRCVRLTGNLPGLRTLVLVALPQNHLTQGCLAAITGHSELTLLSISGDRLTDGALAPIQTIPTLEVLVLNGNFTDAALDIASGLSNLTYLDLTQTHVTDAGIAHLPKLAKLDTLVLNDTKVTSQGMQAVAQLQQLTELYVRDTAIDDNAIVHLRNLAQLKRLVLKGTKISSDGVANLLPALLTECEVIHDSGTYHGGRFPQTPIAQAATVPTATVPTAATQWRAAR